MVAPRIEGQSVAATAAEPPLSDDLKDWLARPNYFICAAYLFGEMRRRSVASAFQSAVP
jgi:hypothetical protein